MICKNCNTDNPKENKVCSNCKKSLETTKKKGALKKYGGLGAVLILCIITFIINSGVFNKKYEVENIRTGHPIVYIKNNTLGVKSIKKSASVLSDYLLANTANMEQPKVFLSENGAGVYFLEGYDTKTSAGSLFASFNGKTKIPVSSNVYNNVQVSENGKYVLFIDMPDIENNMGTLYLCEKNKEKEQIAQNVNLDEFGFSPNSENIVYISQGDLYFQKIGSEREKIDSNVTGISSISNFSSVVYTKDNADYESDLYYWKNNSESVLVGEKVADNLVFTSRLTDNFYFCGDRVSSSNSSLYYKGKSKKVKLVDTNVLAPIEWDCNYNNIIYTKNFSVDNYSSDTYVKMNKKDAKKITSTSEITRAMVSTSYDFKTTAYLSDINNETGLGNLYLKKDSLFKGEELILVSENVYSFVLSKDGKTLVYAKSQNANSYNLCLYKDNKEIVIAENVQREYFILTPDNRSVVYLSNYNAEKDSGNLFCKSLIKLKNDSIKIDTEVTKNFYARSEKQVIYTKNYSIDSGESELHLWKGKKSELIDKGVINVLFEK